MFSAENICFFTKWENYTHGRLSSDSKKQHCVRKGRFGHFHESMRKINYNSSAIYSVAYLLMHISKVPVVVTVRYSLV